MSHVYIEAETYSVSALPDDHPERGFYELTLRRFEGTEWGVTRHGRWWDRDGNSEFLGRGVHDDKEAARFLMRLAEAREVAVKAAPTLRSNGVTVTDVLQGQQ